jgi:hypothetical protein
MIDQERSTIGNGVTALKYQAGFVPVLEMQIDHRMTCACREGAIDISREGATVEEGNQQALIQKLIANFYSWIKF